MNRDRVYVQAERVRKAQLELDDAIEELKEILLEDPMAMAEFLLEQERRC